VSVTITAPAGSCDANRTLNLGSDRWSFRPEVAVSHPFGPNHNWEIDGYANAYFFTDNTAYRGREILRQEPLPGLEGHLATPSPPPSGLQRMFRYAFRGDTLVDGGDENDSQQDIIVGSEVSVALNARHSLLFVFAKALLHQNAPASTTFAIKCIYSWGKG
jgi:hypothetical protein